jgi:hypothetical protein
LVIATDERRRRRMEKEEIKTGESTSSSDILFAFVSVLRKGKETTKLPPYLLPTQYDVNPQRGGHAPQSPNSENYGR